MSQIHRHSSACSSTICAQHTPTSTSPRPTFPISPGFTKRYIFSKVHSLRNVREQILRPKTHSLALSSGDLFGLYNCCRAKISHFLSRTWLIHMWCDSFIRDVTHPYVTRLIHTGHYSFIRDMTHSYGTWLIHTGQDSFIRDMTNPYLNSSLRNEPENISVKLDMRDILSAVCENVGESVSIGNRLVSTVKCQSTVNKLLSTVVSTVNSQELCHASRKCRWRCLRRCRRKCVDCRSTCANCQKSINCQETGVNIE